MCFVLILNIVLFPFFHFCFFFRSPRQFPAICLKIIAFCVHTKVKFNIILYYFTVVLWVLQQIRFVFVLKLRLFQQGDMHRGNIEELKNSWLFLLFFLPLNQIGWYSKWFCIVSALLTDFIHIDHANRFYFCLHFTTLRVCNTSSNVQVVIIINLTIP